MNEEPLHTGDLLPDVLEHRRSDPRPVRVSSRMLHTLVVGANAETRNIGFHIARKLNSRGGITTSTSRTYQPEVMEQSFELYHNLIVCTGQVRTTPIEDQSLVEISDQVIANLVVPIRMVSQFVRDTKDRPMRNGNRRKIVLIGSQAYRKVLTGMSVYCAAKAGLDHFGRCMAWELGPKGYDAFVVHPGNVDNTPVKDAIIQDIIDSRSLVRSDAENIWSLGNAPWLETMKPADVAELVGHIIGGDLKYASGSSIDMAGGMR